MTNIQQSTRSSENVEARLSPPDSNRISSSPGNSASEIVAGRDVERRVLANHGVRAGAGSRRRARRAGSIRPRAAQALGILLGDKIVGHDGEIDAATLKLGDQRLDQRGLAGADRSADADPRRPGLA